MKKRLIVILFIACLFLLTGCNKNEYIGDAIKTEVDAPYEVVEATYKGSTLIQDKFLIGFISIAEYDVPSDSALLSGKHYVFYQVGSIMPKGDYYPVYSTQEEGFSYPEVVVKGLNYAGYFKADGTRVSTEVSDSVLYVRYMSFADAGLVVVVCVAIVFAMLALLCGIVSLFRFIAPKAIEAKKEEKPVVQKQQIKLEDIKDEDMMVAVLVASIDYHEETQQDVRVVSVKEL